MGEMNRDALNDSVRRPFLRGRCDMGIGFQDVRLAETRRPAEGAA